VPSTRYVLLRAGKGFILGLVVGVVWALWAVRRRRPGAGGATSSAPAGVDATGRAAALRPIG
jgi:hypothetical protein